MIGVGPGHPFDGQNAVRVTDLNGQAYVNRLQCEFFDHAGRVWREHGSKVKMVFRSDRDDWVQAMAMAGLVVAMIGVLYLGVLPTRLIELAQASISTIF